MADYTPAKTGNSRVWLIENRARVDHAPVFQSCMKAGGLDQTFGDIESIECPSPTSYGEYVEVAAVKGSKERAKVTLSGRYALDIKSTLLRVARARCSADVQLHLGDCEDPSAFSDFKKVVVLEDAQLTNYSTEDLGSLASGDEGKIDESTDLSVGDVYELGLLTFGEKAADIVTNELVDVVICDTVACGSCSTVSGGCDHIYAVSKAAGGSAGTPPDIVFTIDGGTNWYAHDIDSIATAVDAAGVACLGSYVLVIATNATYPLNYALKAEILPTYDETWTVITTGFVAAGTPRAIWSTGSTAFIVGSAGYVYSCTDPTAGVTVLDAGSATAKQLNAVHGLSAKFVVAAGSAGALIKTEDGTNWVAVTPTNINFIATDFQCVLVLSKYVWLLGTRQGSLYYTLDGGATFYSKSFSGSGSGVVWDLSAPTGSVVYMSHASTTPRGRIFRSIDAAYSWMLLPDTSISMPLSDRFTAIAACEQDPDVVVGVGLADNGSDGIVVLGTAA